jgi:hypothetical protein
VLVARVVPIAVGLGVGDTSRNGEAVVEEAGLKGGRRAGRVIGAEGESDIAL